MIELVNKAQFSAQIEVHSAGTSGWHRGKPADPRARQEAARRGIELNSRSSEFHSGDAEFYDLVLAMDHRNKQDLLDRTDPAHHARIRLLRTFDPALDAADPWNGDVPDPWDGDEDGFGLVFDLIDAACRGLFTELQTMLTTN